MHYSNILLATDGTELMESVFDHCAYVARLTTTTVHVVHVLDVTSLRTSHIEAAWEATYVVLQSEARAILEASRKALVERGVAEDSMKEALLEGHPSEEIGAYVENHAINLVIIGGHRRTSLDRLLIGSVTDKVVRTAKVPVLIVPGA